MGDRVEGGGAERIRVILADDEEAVIEAISELVSSDPALDLVGTARDASEAVDLAERCAPDVALVDVRMPGGGGTTATREIRRRAPDTSVVALSASFDAKTVVSMLHAGAIGYVAKDEPPDQVLRAIHRSIRGRASIAVGPMGDVAERLAEDGSRETGDRPRATTERIERAIFGDVIQMVFQPIVALSSGHVCGVEALARFWTKPRRSPETWFAEAAGVGLLTALELATARCALAELDRLPGGTYLSINASPETFRSPALIELLHGVDADRVVMEMTEQSSAGDYEDLKGWLVPIREMGARLSIDDVGSAFAGLGHVVELAPDFVKLDRSLVAGVDSDPVRCALIDRLVSFADEVGMEIVAEGVETAGDLRTLKELGVPYGQGFYLGRPGPIPLGHDGWPLKWPGRRHAFA